MSKPQSKTLKKAARLTDKQRKRVTGIEFIKIIRATYPNISLVLILSVWHHLQVMDKYLDKNLIQVPGDGKEV